MWVEILDEELENLTEDVILFVRMWVEIYLMDKTKNYYVCHPLREDVSWNISDGVFADPTDGSSSSWGCELKYIRSLEDKEEVGHPLREDVSWNDDFQMIFYSHNNVILFVRMWVEILWQYGAFARLGHPLREDVSWNDFYYVWYLSDAVILFVRMWVEIGLFPNSFALSPSSSSWGCELK